jgi:hypothetical protein
LQLHHERIRERLLADETQRESAVLQTSIGLVPEVVTLVAPVEYWVIHTLHSNSAPPEFMLQVQTINLLLEVCDVAR